MIVLNVHDSLRFACSRFVNDAGDKQTAIPSRTFEGVGRLPAKNKRQGFEGRMIRDNATNWSRVYEAQCRTVSALTTRISSKMTTIQEVTVTYSLSDRRTFRLPCNKQRQTPTRLGFNKSSFTLLSLFHIFSFTVPGKLTVNPAFLTVIRRVGLPLPPPPESKTPMLAMPRLRIKTFSRFHRLFLNTSQLSDETATPSAYTRTNQLRLGLQRGMTTTPSRTPSTRHAHSIP